MFVFNVSKWFVSTTMITMAMVMIDSMRVADGKLDGKIDLAIITSSLVYPHDGPPYKQSISTLTNYVEMGNDKVRVAMVSQGAENKTIIEFPLSGDQSEFEKWIESWQQRYSYHQDTSNALFLCGEQFDFNDNDRAKIIIIHMAWHNTLFSGETIARAERLRKLGVRIYVVYSDEFKQILGQIPLWTTSARLFLVGHTQTDLALRSMEKMSEITPVIVRDLCGLCRFDEQGSCNGKLYEGADDPDYFGDNRVKCQAINAAEIPCVMTNGSKEECDFECNRRWPWEKKSDEYDPDCDQLECGVMKRIGDQPPFMENCPKEHDCRKPVCTSTTSTTSSTTTALTSTSTTTTTISTASSIATTAESSPSSPPLSSTDALGANEGSTDSPDGLSVGVIAGIAAAAVLILLIIIIATVVVMKKRKNGREKKEKLERAKRQQDIDKSASKSVFGKDASIGSKTKGAQTSVMADMSIAQSANQSKKKSAIGDAKSKKPVGIDGSKMAAKSSQVSKMAEGKKPGSKSSVGDVEKKSTKMESSKMLKKK